MTYLLPWFLDNYKIFHLSFHPVVMFMKSFLMSKDPPTPNCLLTFTLGLLHYILEQPENLHLNSQYNSHSLWQINTSLGLPFQPLSSQLFARNKWQKEKPQRSKDCRMHSTLRMCTASDACVCWPQVISVMCSASPPIVSTRQYEDCIRWPYNIAHLLNCFILREIILETNRNIITQYGGQSC